MTSGSLLLVALSAIAAKPLPPGDHIRELIIGDQFRSYSVHIPPSYDPKTPTPVVLVFHSAMMNGMLMARFCGLSEKADQSGFVVVYAN
jgi:polyhydroxybutyrate depolymerase